MKKLGYLGPIGSFSYEAACRWAKTIGESAEYVAMPGFAAILAAVENGSLDAGVLPVENSTHGAVATAMDMLLNLERASVTGEVVLNIEHCLLSASGDDLRYVYSHEQALEQCRRYFNVYYPGVRLIPCASTSEACDLAIKGGAGYGAVAGEVAARRYQLRVVAKSIQDNVFNQTRFLVIEERQMPATGRDKTSIAFAFPGDRPGSLYNVLKVFAAKNINLTRIESRPAKQLMGNYIFYIDFSGHRQSEAGESALQEINKYTGWLKVLGSYPVDMSEAETEAAGHGKR
ncbi:MAG: prephenate dehydratase [Negativicutes bacterium]|nr:prephenate dehydratase [Negativicutes bacterium]